MIQGYYTKEVIEWALNYADLSNRIGVSKSCHEVSLTDKGTIGKKSITPNLILFRSTLFSRIATYVRWV
jgi:hypothetical protein